MQYRFDLVVEGPAAAGCPPVEEKRCSMDVYEVPWKQELTVNWEAVTCIGKPEQATAAPGLLRVPLSSGTVPGLRVGIAQFSEDMPILGSDDSDKIPHGKPLLGGGDHDKMPHGNNLLGKLGHGPVFGEDHMMKELRVAKQSQTELKQLQSLSAFHQFMDFHNKSYASKEEYKHRYNVYKENMKKVQFLQVKTKP